MEYQLTLKKKEFLTDDVIVSDFEVTSEHALEFVPGQFFVTKLPFEDGFVYRSYSLFSPAVNDGHVQFLFRFISGPGTTYLKEMKLGESFAAKGPVGNFQLKEKGKVEVFIATGTGIAPIHSMIETRLLEKEPPKMHLIFGTRTEDDLFMEATFEKWKGVVDIKRTLSRATDSWTGLTGYVTDHLDMYPIKDVTYYVCGSKSMIEDVRGYLEERGVKKEDVHFERFY